MADHAETIASPTRGEAHSTDDICPLNKLFDLQRSAFRSTPVASCRERILRLQELKKLLLNNKQAFITAISADFGGRCRHETVLGELMPSVQGIDYTCKHLARWMKPSIRRVDLHLQPARAAVHYQPLGVAGIMVPWNYPLQLAVLPLAGALAAGNRAMVKMSELAPHTSALFARCIKEMFAPEWVAVIEGDDKVAARFSALAFDHLLFTGSTRIGRQVMATAAQNLTPVTLELGGKSPAIICQDANIQQAAERICFGKSFNAGQTCVAPDYVLCPHHRMDAFIEAYRRSFKQMYPRLDTGDYTSIINEQHHRRLSNLIDDAKNKGAHIHTMAESVQGNDHRRMPPHIVTNVKDNMDMMHDEIFGPVLPLVPYESIEQAIDFIRAAPHPLALYLFGHDQTTQEKVIAQTQSGGVCINDTLLHVAVEDLPFGGIGDSGMGHYHGHEGFLTFSKARSVLHKGKINSAKLMYPPYGGFIGKLIEKVLVR